MSWGQAIGAGIGLVGGYMKNQSTARDVRRSIDAQREAAQNKWQWTIADMKKAGVNPALAYSQGAHASVVGAVGNYENIGAAGATGMAQGSTTDLQDQQSKLQKELIKTEKVLRQPRRDNIISQQKKNKAAELLSRSQYALNDPSFIMRLKRMTQGPENMLATAMFEILNFDQLTRDQARDAAHTMGIVMGAYKGAQVGQAGADAFQQLTQDWAEKIVEDFGFKNFDTPAFLKGIRDWMMSGSDPWKALSPSSSHP